MAAAPGALAGALQGKSQVTGGFTWNRATRAGTPPRASRLAALGAASAAHALPSRSAWAQGSAGAAGQAGQARPFCVWTGLFCAARDQGVACPVPATAADRPV